MIRTAVFEDAAQCADIYNPYILETTVTFEEEPLSHEAFRKRMESIMERYPWIVYEENGKVLGYAYLSAFNPRSAYDWTADLAIYVDMMEKGKGIGSELMQAVIDLAERDGYLKLVSIVTGGNAASEKIHEKFGFAKKAEFDDFGYKMGQWLGVDFYVRELGTAQSDPKRPENKSYEAV